MRLLVGCSLFGLLVAGLSPANASSANISHSFQATTTIPNGSLVSLDPTRSSYVQLANSSNGQRLLGVAVDSTDSLLAVDASPSSTQVATTGVATVLVSTLNGPILVGDQISVSPFNGVGMKADQGSYIIGQAQTNFGASTAGAKTEMVKDTSGKSHQIALGYIRISIALGVSGNNANQQENALQRLAKSLTGHVVSTSRVIISLIIAIVALAALITLVYASIYGSIISIGRNPLAKLAVFRTLGSVLIMIGLTTVVAGITIYLLLR